MSRRIDVPGGFIIGEGDDEERNSPFHKAIVSHERVPGFKSCYKATLECGHTVTAFGDLKLAKGKVLCIPCMEAVQAARPQPGQTVVELHLDEDGNSFGKDEDRAMNSRFRKAVTRTMAVTGLDKATDLTLECGHTCTVLCEEGNIPQFILCMACKLAAHRNS